MENTNTTAILEYVWIDGYENLRSKIKITTITKDENNNISLKIPDWNYDGSSTNQSKNKISDIIIKPVRIFTNPFFDENAFLILCETFNPDNTPHETNNRRKLANNITKYDKLEGLFGIEQEYVILSRNNLPYKWKDLNDPGSGNQENQAYYCSVGGDRCFGREISNEHLIKCMKAGIKICGTNSEVMASQWEYQIGPLDALTISDELWMSRYILNRITEKYECYISYKPKLYKEWNGSGGHTNFSTKKMREEGGIEEIINVCNKLEKYHNEHIKVYGKNNNERLSGNHETSNINNYSYGVGERGASIRIPLQVMLDKKGYLEDRRPASNLDPYLVCYRILETILIDDNN
jgi:glutamine synthetase